MTTTIEQATRVIAEMLSEAGEPCASAELIATRVTQALSDAGLLAGGWRPISEAPRDGTPVIAHWPHLGGRAVVAWVTQAGRRPRTWTASHSFGYLGRMAEGSEPTHWMPLPSPPEEGR